MRQKIEDKLFPEVCSLLNQHHGTQHNERFWSIIIGHWFQITVQLLLNRVNTLEQLLKTEEISNTILYESEYGSLATPDLGSAYFF